ncbi:hypothetical protein HYDPIDRAFT_87584 [Hydnomerulius pinastri MD-312]|nr:hypothetical protein HYDPIDRAFT_87584 [Hydnomerulius pinastri MD-312]
MSEHPVPSQDEQDELLLCCRYGDLQDVQDFTAGFGAEAVADMQDENGNTVLHMTCGNGHIDVLEYLLSLVPPSLLSKKNNAGSIPLHWAALNKHLEISQKLVEFPGGPGVDMIDVKNNAGRSPLGEAEMAEWDDGARWFVQVMRLDEVNEEEEDAPVDPSQAIEVEIEDAEGQVAKMTVGGSKPSESKEETS